MIRQYPGVRWMRLPRRRKLLLIEAGAVLAAASAMVQLRPFRRAIVMGSRPIARPRALAADVLADLRWSIDAAARRSPWRTMCIEQGLALQFMLRRRGVPAVLHYGVRLTAPDNLQAHVWVSVDGEMLIGGEEAPGFKPITSYPASETKA